MRKTVKVAVVLIAASGFFLAARQTANQSKQGAKSTQGKKTNTSLVSGHVFAITAGGDIRPARLASVYLLYGSGEDSAAHHWSNEFSEAIERYVAQPIGEQKQEFPPLDANWEAAVHKAMEATSQGERAKLLYTMFSSDLDANMALSKTLRELELLDHGHLDDRTECTRGLVNYEIALLGVRRWRWVVGKVDQLTEVQADEEGQFMVAVPRAGRYVVIVRGRAGFNDAIWTSETTVMPGETAVLKLGYPKEVCLVM